MQWSAVLAVLAASRVALADDLTASLLDRQLRSADPTDRSAAAKRLAKAVADKEPGTIGVARMAVLTDEMAVRVPLLDALIDAGAIPRAAAAFVPTATVFGKMTHRLLPKLKPAELPPVDRCGVVDASPRGVTIRCTISRCDGIMRENRTFTFTTGVRWTVDADQPSHRADGSCGDIMM